MFMDLKDNFLPLSKLWISSIVVTLFVNPLKIVPFVLDKSNQDLKYS